MDNQLLLFIILFTLAIAVVIKIFSEFPFGKCVIYSIGVVLIIAILIITKGLFAPIGYAGYRYYRGSW